MNRWQARRAARKLRTTTGMLAVAGRHEVSVAVAVGHVAIVTGRPGDYLVDVGAVDQSYRYRALNLDHAAEVVREYAAWIARPRPS